MAVKSNAVKIGCVIVIGICVAIVAFCVLALPDNKDTAESAKPPSEDKSIWTQLDNSSQPTPPPAPPAASADPSGDPYAAGQRRLAENDYAAGKEQLLRQSWLISNAVECRVIEEGPANEIILLGINRLSSALISAGLSDYHPDLLPALQASGLQGHEAAKKPDGCNYWKQNPDQVALMRDQARLAAIGGGTP